MPVLECEGFGVHAYDVGTEREVNTHKKTGTSCEVPACGKCYKSRLRGQSFLVEVIRGISVDSDNDEAEHHEEE